MAKCSSFPRTQLMALALFVGCGAFLAGSVTAGAATGAKRPQSSNRGEITGKIHFQGPKPQPHPIDMGKDSVCASLHTGPVYAQDGEVNADGTLPNAFIYIKHSSATLPSTAPRNPVTLTQRGCQYDPHVVGVMVGQPFEVINLDPTTHNVHVIPKSNREWNVSQQPGSPSVVRRLQHTETMIPVRCNVHPWMKAYIGVVDNPFYAVTGKDGSFALKGLPPGNYTIEVWTATFGAQERNLVVRAGEATTADFTFENH
ncbi:MAG: carboxypeptidase regulatory-like domain-containing protein [Acidobacteriota bacterium]|nr:carboxypeptidase regulatory-like domain-containing protein [Acidobacteriota bacterium]